MSISPLLELKTQFVRINNYIDIKYMALKRYYIEAGKSGFGYTPSYIIR